MSVWHPVNQDIWLMQPDGRDLRRIADIGFPTPSIAWSQRGDWIYVMNIQGYLRVNAFTGAIEELAPGIQSGRLRLLK
jgi:hypothetical protein